jgi:hypothetical protein
MGILKPLKNPLTFWHCSGEILWRGCGPNGVAAPQPIDREMADSLCDLFWTDMLTCVRAGDDAAGNAAAQLFTQILNAMDAQVRHCRAVGRPLNRKVA